MDQWDHTSEAPQYNLSTQETPGSPQETFSNRLIVGNILYISIGLLAILLNGHVFIASLRSKSLRRPEMWPLINLVVSDAFSGFALLSAGSRRLNIILAGDQLVQVPGSYCMLTAPFFLFAIAKANDLAMLAIAIERCFAIKWLLRYRYYCKRIALTLLAMVWIGTLLHVLAGCLDSVYSPLREGTIICYTEQANSDRFALYHQGTTMASNWLTLVLYLSVVMPAHVSLTRSVSPELAQTQFYSEKQRRITRVLFFVVCVTFLLRVVPRTTVTVMLALSNDPVLIMKYMQFIWIWIYTTHCINLLAYCLPSQEMRDAVLQCWCKPPGLMSSRRSSTFPDQEQRPA